MSRRVRFLERPWLTLTVAIVVAGVFSALWLLRSTVQYETDPEPVAAGQAAVGVQATYMLKGMTTTEVLPDGGDGEPPMAGASFVAVKLEYTAAAADDEVICLIELLGEDRYWTTYRHASVRDWGYESNCTGSSGTVLKFFEIPTSAVAEIRGIRVRGGGETLILGGEVKA
ncbi:hypothetical protein [Micropruina sp.]|uniref:hypothetical protein n=1 Tax=Micropruina sp. TaxID=2737536 RepID=UPI0039E45213